jgi:hypothetical protein
MDTKVVGGGKPIEDLFIGCLGFTKKNNGGCNITVVQDLSAPTLRLQLTKIEI